MDVQDVNTVYSFDGNVSTGVRFSETYTVERIIYPPNSSRSLILICKKNDDTNYRVAVKMMDNNDETTQKELENCKQVAKMKKHLGLQCIVGLHGYFRIDDIKSYRSSNSDIEEFWRKEKVSSFLNIMMDYVPHTLEETQKKEITEKIAVACLIDMFYTIWKARTYYFFYHGDINSGNIMFMRLPENDNRRARRYIMGKMELEVESPYLPILIDFEKSGFGNDPAVTERFSDVRNIVQAFDSKFKSALFKILRNDILGVNNRWKDDNRFTPKTILEIIRNYKFFNDARKKLHTYSPYYTIDSTGMLTFSVPPPLPPDI